MCNAKNHSTGCTCGWGGEGHLGRRDGQYADYLSSGEIFNHLTKCSYCGELVYFVQYNGGKVYFDSLGIPWPKHSCYYENNDFTKWERDVHYGISQWIEKLKNPYLGIVMKTEENELGDKSIIVRCSDKINRKLYVHVTFSLEKSMNELVLFSIIEEKLIRPYASLETIIDITVDRDYIEKPISLKLPYTPPAIWNCSHCSAKFTSTRELSSHLKSTHSQKINGA